MEMRFIPMLVLMLQPLLLLFLLLQVFEAL